jgi:hypothetical protein
MLELDGGVNCCGDTLELCQNGIPRLMDFLATMRGNDIGKQVEAGIKLSVGLLLIESGKPAITGHIGVEDGGKLAFHLFVSDTGGIKINRRT